ncbi:hypothetical protein [Microbacterium murale]|uniref:Lipoprotein n=1 Tax=Microbacterium murale TaxID=1081040 RepID=A0ABU0P9Q1_9MICO|nr:hypothetical protein [Microbacterium murale]MDQ0644061.1 hypothetical protein [Microbacterium murale]
MPKTRSDALRRVIIPLTLALLLVPGCSGAPVSPVATPTHLDLGEDWGDDVGNGVTLLGTEDALAAVIAAMRAEHGGTMTGVFVDTADRMMTFVVSGRGGSVEAEFTVNGVSTRIVLTDDVAYVLPSPTGEAADGAYACMGVDDPAVARWRTLLDPVRTVAEFSADASAIAAAGEGTANIVLGAEGTLGALTVSRDGPPLPTALVRADAAGTMEVEFSDWGETEVAPPSPLADDC